MRLLRRLALFAILAGVFAWLRKVLSEDIVARTSAPPATPPSGADPAPKPAPPAAAPKAAAQQASNGGEPTKAELYERAQELGIEGRSKMSKTELQRAISEKS